MYYNFQCFKNMKVLFWSMKVGYSNFATSNQLKTNQNEKIIISHSRNDGIYTSINCKGVEC